MSGPNAFFVSDSLAELFGEELPSDQAYVEIGEVKGLFVAYSSSSRSLKLSISQGYNPFDIFNSSKIKATIIFPKGDSRSIEYTTFEYKIEQASGSFVVTIGDKNE